MIEDFDFDEDIRHMSKKELEELAKRIRAFLIEKVSKTGGHLASNLGVVELTLALHKVFDSPTDKIIWDVGHQVYVHKILTGRATGFDKLRMLDGLSGFPRRSESVHDHFDAGHSSTSISVAYGMAKARDLKGENHAVVAVIGDGALTGGVAFEALNNAGHADENGKKTNLIVILNDNEMSIGRNTGGITQYLSGLRSTFIYNNFKRKLKKTLLAVPVAGRGVYNVLESIRDRIKFALIQDGVFEGLGFKYLGPIDGNNLEEMISILEGVRNIDGPVMIHVITQKGKGYLPAEQNPDMFHGIGRFDKETGRADEVKGTLTYSQVFGRSLLKLAKEDERIVAISAAMIDAVGLGEFKKEYPERLFDVAIAEQHAVDFAVGLALEGYRPVVAIYSTFIQRAYDQILIDVCLQNLPVVFCLDRSGNVGGDGQTHHGIYDISYLTHMPNMTVLAPKDAAELERMLSFALTSGGPCAIRYPRAEAADIYGLISKAGSRGEDMTDVQGTGKGADMADAGEKNLKSGGGCGALDGKIEVLKRGKDGICLLAVGKMVLNAVLASEILEKNAKDVTVVSSSFVKPADEEGIISLCREHGVLVTLEDNTVAGGFGNIVSRICSQAGYIANASGSRATGENNEASPGVRIVTLGWPDEAIGQGEIKQLEEKYGLSPEAIAKVVMSL